MEAIHTDDAPDALGPYSQGIKDGGRIYVAGQGPVDPTTGEVDGEDIAEQTARVFENAAAILAAAGASLDDVVQVTVYLRDMDDFEAMNEVYAEYVSEPYPARETVAVADLPLEAIDVEIAMVA